MTATAADNYYKLVHNTTEFQNISSNLAGNYMLANDIDFTDPVTLAPKAVLSRILSKLSENDTLINNETSTYKL